RLRDLHAGRRQVPPAGDLTAAPPEQSRIARELRAARLFSADLAGQRLGDQRVALVRPLRARVPAKPGVQPTDELHLAVGDEASQLDRKSTRLNSSHVKISYAVFCLKKKRKI